MKFAINYPGFRFALSYPTKFLAFTPKECSYASEAYLHQISFLSLAKDKKLSKGYQLALA